MDAARAAVPYFFKLMSVQLNAEECNIRCSLGRGRMHTLLPTPYRCNARPCVFYLRDPCGCATAHRAVAASALSAIIVPASHFDVDALTLHVPPPLAAVPPSRNRRPQSRPFSLSHPFLPLFLSFSAVHSVRPSVRPSDPRQRSDAFMRAWYALRMYRKSMRRPWTRCARPHGRRRKLRVRLFLNF